MSQLGYHKAQLTKASNALRQKVAEVDRTIMERVLLTGNPDADVEAVHGRKHCIYTTSSGVDRAVSLLKSRWMVAEEFARNNLDEHGEQPDLEAIQSHWETNGMDRAIEEAEALLDRLDASIKLLPTPEAIMISGSCLSCAASNVGQNLNPGSPSPTSNSISGILHHPNVSHRSAQDMVVRNHAHIGPANEDRPSDPIASAPLDHHPPATATELQRPQTGAEDQQHSQPGNGFLNRPTSFTNPPFSCPPGLTCGSSSNPLGCNGFLSGYNNCFSSGQNYFPNVPAFEQHLKLPAFELPEFSGEVDEFPEFWDLYCAAVHNNISVPVALKFLYLKTHLKGNAAKLIANFKLTAENYDDAVRIVTNTYNRPEILRSRLWDKLVEQQASSGSVISQRTTLCLIKAIWAQLKHLNEESASIGTIKLIRSKFPSRTREKVGELKEKGDSLWTVDELLNALDTVIEQLEVIEDANPTTDSIYNTTSCVRQGSRSPSRHLSSQRSPISHALHSTSPARHRRNSRSPFGQHRDPSPPSPQSPQLPRQPTKQHRSREPRCTFCLRRGHKPERCTELRTPQERRSVVIRSRLCWKCLQDDHWSGECTAPPCYFCDRHHHSSLCMWRSSTSGNRGLLDTSHQSRSPSRRVKSGRRAREQSSRESSLNSRASYLSGASPSRSLSPTSQRRVGSPHPRKVGFLDHPRGPTCTTQASTCVPAPHEPTTSDVESECDGEELLRSQYAPYTAYTGSFSYGPCSAVLQPSTLYSTPRLMVVHARTYNYKTCADELLAIFLDSGSQYSFIRKSVATSLGLPLRCPQNITMLTFGGHESTEESAQVTLTLWDQSNRPVQLHLWTRQIITTVPSMKNLEDPVSSLTSERVDILIGIDYYWKIVDLHENEQLPSGLILSQTRFGPVLSGVTNLAPSNATSLVASPSDNIKDDGHGGTDQPVKSPFGPITVGLQHLASASVDAHVIEQVYSAIRVINGSIHTNSPPSDHLSLAGDKVLILWTFEEQLPSEIVKDATDRSATCPNTYNVPAVIQVNSWPYTTTSFPAQPLSSGKAEEALKIVSTLTSPYMPSLPLTRTNSSLISSDLLVRVIVCTFMHLTKVYNLVRVECRLPDTFESLLLGAVSTKPLITLGSHFRLGIFSNISPKQFETLANECYENLREMFCHVWTLWLQHHLAALAEMNVAHSLRRQAVRTESRFGDVVLVRQVEVMGSIWPVDLLLLLLRSLPRDKQ